ncbi:MAG TPA: PilZ domain-containing protein [Gammaproteobacteria bacterium]|nr:PilZ domain-containing protein [Gammaproteobacteria bacterium]
MPKRESLLTDEFAVTGVPARRVLATLAHKGLMLSVTHEASGREHLTSVVDQISTEPCRILLDQPPDADKGREVFRVRDTLIMVWTNIGMRFGARARVEAVRTHDAIPAYEIRIEEPVYRQQRREAFRVPVGPQDGIGAQLTVDDQKPALEPVLKDLSATGCRLALDIEWVVEAELEPGARGKLSLTFPKRSNALSSQLRIIWTERAGAGVVDLGATWLEPKDEFVSQVESFIFRKERLLLKRRAGQ